MYLVFLLPLKPGYFSQLDLLTVKKLNCRLLASSSRGLLWVKGLMPAMGLPILGIIEVLLTEEGVMDTMVEEVAVVILDPFSKLFCLVVVSQGMCFVELH